MLFVAVCLISGTFGCGSEDGTENGAPSLASQGASLTLQWDAVQDTSVLGYRVYHGTFSHMYHSWTEVHGVTTHTISNLGYNTTYYFAVTAYNAYSEGLYSNEVSATTAASPQSDP